jgi:hypothetical protein
MANSADFKAQLIGGGARPNQFRVELSVPSYVTAGVIAAQRGQFLCKSAQLPAATIEDIPVQYRGRAIHFAGERTFAPWTTTIINDTTFNIRNAMEIWSNGIQNLTTSNGRTNPRDYQTDLIVHQLDRNGATIKSYKFVDAYPTNIGAIGLSFDTTNAIEEFEVEFTYNFWTSNTATSSGVGVNVSVDTPLGSFPINI